jgi:hypothetical protein
MGRKSSFGTNSWWNHRMVGNFGKDRDIDDHDDRKQDAYLKKLEESRNPSRKKIRNPEFRRKK